MSLTTLPQRQGFKRSRIPPYRQLQEVALLLCHLLAAALVAAGRARGRVTLLGHRNRLPLRVFVQARRCARDEDGPEDKECPGHDPDPRQGAAEPTWLCCFRLGIASGFN